MAAGRSLQILLFCFIYSVSAFLEPGIIELTLTPKATVGDFQRSLYNSSKIIVKLTCNDTDATVKVQWWLWQADCLQAFQGVNNVTVDFYKEMIQAGTFEKNSAGAQYVASGIQYSFDCNVGGYVVSNEIFGATLPPPPQEKPDSEAAVQAPKQPVAQANPQPQQPVEQTPQQPDGQKAQNPLPAEQNPAEVQKPKTESTVKTGSKPPATQAEALKTPQTAPQKRSVHVEEKKLSRKRRAEETKPVKAESGKSEDKVGKADKASSSQQQQHPDKKDSGTPLYVTKTGDGIFLLLVQIDSASKVEMQVQMKADSGYLSPIDWPNLPFYASMCVLYVIYGIAWLIMLAMNWRDLLRIQFWIGAVILLGMLEKAVYFGEYESINSTGMSVRGALILAQLVSAMKRTLARMLVIIVSLGYGIVKPRLGADQNKVVGIGVLSFILNAVEGCMGTAKDHGARTNGKDVLGLLFMCTLLDVYICYWIFTSLVQTTRVLRLRRNVVKLSLYRHFTNTLVFAVLASLVFMIWSMSQHRFVQCLSDWKEIWVDDAFWHMLFVVILLVIIILWRPSANNQRYAFSPLLDAVDEEDEDDETTISDAFDGINKRPRDDVRNLRNPEKKKDKVDEDLKWIDENIPASVADAALPSLLDSDEEIVTTKFEVSKME